MNQTKFTPGPWKISEYRNGHLMIIEGSDEWGVAEVGYPNRDPNANLIAKSPTMYAYIEKHAKAGCSEAIEIIESVNAKS